MAIDLGQLAPSTYYVLCDDCNFVSQSESIAKAASDDSWHNTMTGHNSRVEDESGMVL